MKALAIPLALALAAATPALAHDYWATGEKVPAWVKSWCCGADDAHRLSPAAVHIKADGYHVDGIKSAIPVSKAMSSPDGQYWAFFKDRAGDDDPYVNCFFAPLNGV